MAVGNVSHGSVIVPEKLIRFPDDLLGGKPYDAFCTKDGAYMKRGSFGCQQQGIGFLKAASVDPGDVRAIGSKFRDQGGAALKLQALLPGTQLQGMRVEESSGPIVSRPLSTTSIQSRVFWTQRETLAEAKLRLDAACVMLPADPAVAETTIDLPEQLHGCDHFLAAAAYYALWYVVEHSRSPNDVLYAATSMRHMAKEASRLDARIGLTPSPLARLVARGLELYAQCSDGETLFFEMDELAMNVGEFAYGYVPEIPLFPFMAASAEDEDESSDLCSEDEQNEEEWAWEQSGEQLSLVAPAAQASIALEPAAQEANEGESSDSSAGIVAVKYLASQVSATCRLLEDVHQEQAVELREAAASLAASARCLRAEVADSVDRAAKHAAIAAAAAREVCELHEQLAQHQEQQRRLVAASPLAAVPPPWWFWAGFVVSIAVVTGGVLARQGLSMSGWRTQGRIG